MHRGYDIQKRSQAGFKPVTFWVDSVRLGPLTARLFAPCLLTLILNSNKAEEAARVALGFSP